MENVIDIAYCQQIRHIQLNLMLGYNTINTIELRLNRIVPKTLFLSF